MDIKKILACGAALALLGGALTVNAADNPIIPSIFASAEESSTVVELAHVGDRYNVSLGNASGTPTWTSADEKIATVVSTGGLNAQITAVSVGTTTIYASLADQTVALTVKVLAEAEEVEQTIQLPDLVFGENQNTANTALDGADAADFQWSSSDESVATVDAKGTITAVGKGTCVITAVNGKTTYKINVTSNYDGTQDPTDPVVIERSEVVKLSNDKVSQKISIGELPEGVSPVWSSSDTNIATVDQSGTVTAVSSGECKVNVQIGTTIYSFKVESTYDPSQGIPEKELSSITLSDSTPSRTINVSAPEGAQIKWSSSDESVATVDQKGTVTATGSGSCKIIAYYGGVNYIVKVESTYTGQAPTAPTAEINGIGQTLQLSGGEGVKSWSSSDEKVATVDSTGKVTATGLGQAVITAEFENGTSTQINVVVNPKTVYGDATEDGTVNLNDAVAILQFVALRQKYPLTEQGQRNADCYNPGDGISGKDALAIQMLDAKVIKTLPLIENN
ncbi:MAG: Ig-like domain-containing protein [Ruminococcus sp.]|nr:Ig-like domain-containing protein [Ruminococcus sp.]